MCVWHAGLQSICGNLPAVPACLLLISLLLSMLLFFFYLCTNSETVPAAIPPSLLHVLYPVVQVSEVEEKLTLPTTREWWWWGDYCCWSHRRWECAAAEGPARSFPHLLQTGRRLSCRHAASGLPSALRLLQTKEQSGYLFVLHDHSSEDWLQDWVCWLWGELLETTQKKSPNLFTKNALNHALAVAVLDQFY